MSTPENALATFQSDIREVAQEVLTRAALVVIETLNSEGCDPEYALKAAREFKNIAGAEPEKKADPNANLPTFNITFVNGSAQVTAQLVPIAEVVPEDQPAHLLDDATPLMLTQSSVNDDLAELLGELP